MGHGCVVSGSVPFHLLEEMTHCFCEDRKLGSGSYGKVYMGESKNGEKIAVKMLHDMPGIDEEQFETEYHNLARLQHHNIVRLVGYSHEIRREYVMYNGKIVGGNWAKRALCLEYMHNGSLDRFLYDESNGLNWCTCYAIIKGICNGVKYLHEELEPPMYHLDLKPANVLLNEAMVPKIADFALSRLFGGQQTQRTKSSIGTLGYQPPEYHDAGIISIKSDIFSLGVVIIKIMRGPKGYFRSVEMSSEQFITTVHEKWRNRLQATSKYELDTYSEQVKRCAEIALSCLDADRSKRPSIGVIVSKLNETEPTLRFPSALPNGQGSSISSMKQMRFGNVIGCHDKDSFCSNNEHDAHHRDVSCRDSTSVCQNNDRGCRNWGAACHDNTDDCRSRDSACRDNEGGCCDRRAVYHDNKNGCRNNKEDCHNRGAP